MALVVRNLPAHVGSTRDVGSLPGSGRSPGEGHGNSLQFSCLGNRMDREAWWASIHRVANSSTQLKWLSMRVCVRIYLTIIYMHMLTLCWVAQLCPALCNPLDYSPPGSSVLGDSPGTNTAMGCYLPFSSPGDLPNLGTEPSLPHSGEFFTIWEPPGEPYIRIYTYIHICIYAQACSNYLFRINSCNYTFGVTVYVHLKYDSTYAIDTVYPRNS